MLATAVLWPNPLEPSLWGYIKSNVYEKKLCDLTQLKQEIRRVREELNDEMCERVIFNFIDIIIACGASRGGQMPDIVFHT